MTGQRGLGNVSDDEKRCLLVVGDGEEDGYKEGWDQPRKVSKGKRPQ